MDSLTMIAKLISRQACIETSRFSQNTKAIYWDLSNSHKLDYFTIICYFMITFHERRLLWKATCARWFLGNSWNNSKNRLLMRMQWMQFTRTSTLVHIAGINFPMLLNRAPNDQILICIWSFFNQKYTALEMIDLYISVQNTKSRIQWKILLEYSHAARK